MHGLYAAQHWAQSQRPPTVAIQATLLLLAGYADENYSCHPGMDRIAEETIQSRSTVIRQIALLEEVGLIRREYRYDQRGKRTSNRYILNIGATATREDFEAARDRLAAGTTFQSDTQSLSSKNDTLSSKSGTTKFHPDDTGTRSSRTRSSRTPPFPPEEGQQQQAATGVAGEAPVELALVGTPSPKPDRFEEFWEVYDKKRGKKAAEQKWQQAVRKSGVTEQEVVEAAASYIASQKAAGKHPQFTKDPATWLNGAHWQDEVQQQQAIIDKRPEGWR